MSDKKPYSLLLGENSESDEKLANKLILIAPTIVIILLLILIPNSPVYGWLNKGRYQQIRSESDQLLLDTATGHVESYSQNWDAQRGQPTVSSEQNSTE